MQIDHHSNTQDGCPHVVKDPAPMWTQDGYHKMASREGQLGGTRPAREGSWGWSGQQVRAAGRDQSCKGGQLGVTRPAGEGN